MKVITKPAESLPVRDSPEAAPHSTTGGTTAPSRGPRAKLSRTLVGGVAAAALLGAVLAILASEQLTPAGVIVPLLAMAGLAWSLGRKHRRYSVLIAAELLVVFAYTWSLGETIHVVVRVTPSGYTANVGGNIRHYTFPQVLPGQAVPPSPGVPALGLVAGTARSYIVGPTGPTGVDGLAWPLADLANTFRYLTPAPAWANMRVRYTAGGRGVVLPVSQPTPVQGAWVTNARGETTGTLGAIGRIPTGPATSFVFSGDLVRADGLQGLLVGSNLPQQGVFLSIRLDKRQAWWQAWDGRIPDRWTMSPPPTQPFSVDGVAMIQYLLRTVLPSVMLSLVLLLLVLPAFNLALLLGWLIRITLRRFGWGRSGTPRIDTDVTGFTAEARRTQRRAEENKVGAEATGGMTPVPEDRMERRRRFAWAPLGRAADLVAVGFAGIGMTAMAWISTFGYQRLPTTQDDVIDLFQAKTLATGSLWAPVPKYKWFFVQWSMLWLHGHWFGKYPPGWPLVLSVGVLLGGAWLVNPVISGIGVLLVYLIGREMYGRKLALLAALLALTSPFLLYIGAGYYAQPAAWLFLGTYVYLLLVWRRRDSSKPGKRFEWRWRNWWLLVMAGFCLGLAIATRQLDGVIFAIPFMVVFLKRPLAATWLVVGTIVPMTLFLIYNQLLFGTWLPSGYVLVSSFDKPGFGPGVGGLGKSFYGNFSPQSSIWNIVSELQNLHLGLFGWPFFMALAVVLIPFVAGRSTGYDRLLLVAALTIIAGYVFFWWPAINQASFPRYWYMVMPCACLLAARGFQELYRLPGLPALRLPRSRAAAAIWPSGLLLVMLWFNFGAYTPKLERVVEFWDRNNSVPAAIVQRANIHNAIVFVVRHPDWSSYGCVFDRNSPDIKSADVIWAHDWGADDRKLMREFPDRSYYRLDGAILTPIDPISAALPPQNPQPSENGSQECGARTTS